jgi:hypothetical protein
MFSPLRNNIFPPGKLTQALLVAPPLAICVYAFPATAINAVPVLIGMPGFPVAATGVLAGPALGQGRWFLQCRCDLDG